MRCETGVTRTAGRFDRCVSWQRWWSSESESGRSARCRLSIARTQSNSGPATRVPNHSPEPRRSHSPLCLSVSCAIATCDILLLICPHLCAQIQILNKFPTNHDKPQITDQQTNKPHQTPTDINCAIFCTSRHQQHLPAKEHQKKSIAWRKTCTASTTIG